MTVTCLPFPHGIQTPHPPQSEAVVIGPQVLLLLIGKVGLVPVVQGLVPLLLHTQVRLVPLEGILQHSTGSIRLLELVVDTGMRMEIGNRNMEIRNGNYKLETKTVRLGRNMMIVSGKIEMGDGSKKIGWE